MKHVLDGLGFVTLAVRLENIGDVQKGRSLQPHVDEGALHARKHANHFTEVDVANETAGAGALDEKVLQDAVHYNGDARFPRRAVDKNVFHDAYMRVAFAVR